MRDKQIEEMAFDLCLIDRCMHLPRAECNNTTCDHCEAEALYNAGYRKASDVAREIFEEIDKRLEALLKFYPCNGEFEDAKRFVDFHWKHIRHSIMCDYDAELKKKYINK